MDLKINFMPINEHSVEVKCECFKYVEGIALGTPVCRHGNKYSPVSSPTLTLKEARDLSLKNGAKQEKAMQEYLQEDDITPTHSDWKEKNLSGELLVEATAYEYLKTDLKLTEWQARLIAGKIGVCARHAFAERLALAEKRQLTRIQKLVEDYQTPYPLDVFPEPWEGWQKEIQELASQKNRSIDCISAHYARWQEKLVLDYLLSKLQDNE